jgi:hypothetical protein
MELVIRCPKLNVRESIYTKILYVFLYGTESAYRVLEQ